MFAEIYPIKRLPRRFCTFTYEVPDRFKNAMARGVFVRIPWRGVTLRGVVASCSETTETTRVKPLLEILSMPSIGEDLTIYEQTAEETIQSVSSVLDSAFPSPRKRVATSSRISPSTSRTFPEMRLSQETVQFLHRAVDESIASLQKTNKAVLRFIPVIDVIESALLAGRLASQTKHPVLLLLPHDHDVDVVEEVVGRWPLKIKRFTSALTDAQRHDLAESWRRGEVDLLLTTRLGSLLPPPPHLGGIVIARSGVEEHAQYDRNPRYDARRLARAWCNDRKSILLQSDVMPRLIDLALEVPVTERLWPPVHVIDQNVAVRFSNEPLLSDELLDAITRAQTQHERVLLLCNQKGLAGKLRCKSCEFTEVCATCTHPLAVYASTLYCHTCHRTTPRPNLCRACKRHTLETVRKGTGALKRLLTSHFPKASVSVIEKGREEDAKADIIIATTAYYARTYNPLTDRFGVVAIPQADQFTNGENALQALRTLLEWRLIRERSGAKLFVQSWEPSLVESLLNTSQAIVEKEWQARREYDLPPVKMQFRLKQRTEAPFDWAEIKRPLQTHKETRMIEEGEGLIIRSKNVTLLSFLKTLDDHIIIENQTEL